MKQQKLQRNFPKRILWLACVWFVAFILVGAKAPAGCGGNLTDNCLQDLDCKGGQLCSSGVCRQFVRPKSEGGATDAGPDTPDTTDTAPDKLVKPNTCTSTSCPSGQYCGAAGKCEPLPTPKNFCDYKLNAEGMMQAPSHTLSMAALGDTMYQPGLAVSPDGRYLATLTQTSHKDRLKLWDIQTGKLLRSFPAQEIVWHQNMVPFVEFSRDSKHLYANLCSFASGGPTQIHCDEMRGWSVTDGKSLDVTKKYGGKVYRIAFSPNGMYTATIQDDDSKNDPALMIWKAGTAKAQQIHSLGTEDRPAHHGPNAADDLCKKDTDCRKNEYCKDIGRGTLTCYVKTRKGAHSYLVNAMLISDKGIVFSGDAKGTLIRWDAKGSKDLKSIEHETSRIVVAMAWNSTQTRVIVSMQVTTKTNSVEAHLAWFDESGKELNTALLTHGISPTTLAFGPEERIHMTSSSKGITPSFVAGWAVWHGASGRPAHRETPYRTAQQITDRTITSNRVSNSLDGRVRVELFTENEKVYLHVWRCQDPCQGVRCGAGTFCKFGRCVTPKAECKGTEARTCYTGPKEKLDIGECKAGTMICLEGYWRGRCYQEVHPESEICNNKDNDCDGKVDNQCVKPCKSDNDCYPILKGQVCQAGRCVPKPCKTGFECGKGQVCANGACAACQSSKEVCDGKDNDCDGAVDEGCSCNAHALRRCEDQLGNGCSSGGVKFQMCVRYIPNPDKKWTRCLCQNSSACQKDSDCGTSKDLVCQHNACVPKPCTANTECPNSKSCSFGVCNNTQCTTDASCSFLGQNYVCVAGRCFDGSAEVAP